MDSKALTPWGLAISLLMKEAKVSRRKAAQRRLAPYSAFTQWKTSRQGPSVAVLDRLLGGLGLSWQDWARVFRSGPARRTDNHPPDQRKRGGKRTPKSIRYHGLRLLK